MGKLAIALKGFGAEIYGTVCCHIRMALVDQGLDHLQHACNLLGCLRVGGCRFYIHVRHVFLALCDIAFRDGFRIDAFLNGFFDDLVIYIREVGNVVDIVALILEITAHSIENDHRTCVSDMDKVIYSRAAHIHFYLSRLQWHKLFFSSAQSIKNFHNRFLLVFSYYFGCFFPVRSLPLLTCRWPAAGLLMLCF